MNDDSLFPLTLRDESRDWNLVFNIDGQVKRFNMKLNNRNYFDLPDESNIILRKSPTLMQQAVAKCLTKTMMIL